MLPNPLPVVKDNTENISQPTFFPLVIEIELDDVIFRLIKLRNRSILELTPRAG